MTEPKATYTLDATGRALSVECEGVSAPADYSFACVNDYVHAHDRHFEELQYLALGMANEIERLEKLLHGDQPQPICKRDKKPCGQQGGHCLECPNMPSRDWLEKR